MARFSPILIIALCALLFLPGIAAADQPTPFAPMGNVTGNYSFIQGTDNVVVNTNIPVSTEDVCYPEEIWILIVLSGIAFIFLAAVFVARSDNVPSIAILMCGMIAFGLGYAASEMAPLVGRVDTFSQVVQGASSNSIYLSSMVVYTTSPWMSYACWGIGIAGIIVAIAGVLSFFGVFQRKGLAQAQKGNFLEQDVADAQEPTVIKWREKEPRK